MSVSEEGEHIQAPGLEKGPDVGCIIFLLILLSVLLGGSLFFFLRSRGTVTDHRANMVTPTATSTPTEVPTDTPPPQSLFFDTFANNAHGWPLSKDASGAGYIRTLANRMLILTDTNQGTTLVESLPTGTFDDCMVSVVFTILTADKADSVGIYIRGDSNLDHDYRIDINGNNTYDIAKEYLNATSNLEVSMLDGPKSTTSLKPPGQQNTMTVIMKGSTLILLINNTKVSSITDTDYMSGQIALFTRASASSNGVSATFSKVEVDRVPDQLP